MLWVAFEHISTKAIIFNKYNTLKESIPTNWRPNRIIDFLDFTNSCMVFFFSLMSDTRNLCGVSLIYYSEIFIDDTQYFHLRQE